MDCKKTETMMNDALYGDLSEKDLVVFQKHLSDCPQCSEEFKELQQLIGVVEKKEGSEREEEFWDNYWYKLKDKIEDAEVNAGFFERISSIINSSKKLVFQLSAATALVIVGILIGKFGFNEQPVILPDQPSNSKIVNAALQQRTDNYIQKSKVLLLGLVNFENDEIENISLKKHKEVSQGLIKEASFLREKYSTSTDKHLKKLISDLEVILLQIANLEEEQDIDGIEMVKRGVETKGIFLKININEMQNISKTPISQTEKSKVKI